MRGSVLLLILLTFAMPLQAQSLEPGTLLRVQTRGATVTGNLFRWAGDSLVVRPAVLEGKRLDVPYATPVSDLLDVERAVSRSRGRGAARGALWGGLIGGIGGALVGGLDARDCPCYLIENEAEGAFWGGLVFGGLGAVAGGLVGMIAPGERWEPVALEP